MVTATQAGRQLGVSFPTANHALATLVRAGVLRELGSRRNRIFVADEVIRVLEGRAASPPDRQGPP